MIGTNIGFTSGHTLSWLKYLFSELSPHVFITLSQRYTKENVYTIHLYMPYKKKKNTSQMWLLLFEI